MESKETTRKPHDLKGDDAILYEEEKGVCKTFTSTSEGTIKQCREKRFARPQSSHNNSNPTTYKATGGYG
jgi:hypothetical protein